MSLTAPTLWRPPGLWIPEWFTAGKAQRDPTTGKRKRADDGKRVHNTADITGCCCGPTATCYRIRRCSNDTLITTHSLSEAAGDTIFLDDPPLNVFRLNGVCVYVTQEDVGPCVGTVLSLAQIGARYADCLVCPTDALCAIGYVDVSLSGWSGCTTCRCWKDSGGFDTGLIQDGDLNGSYSLAGPTVNDEWVYEVPEAAGIKFEHKAWPDCPGSFFEKWFPYWIAQCSPHTSEVRILCGSVLFTFGGTLGPSTTKLWFDSGWQSVTIADGASFSAANLLTSCPDPGCSASNQHLVCGHSGTVTATLHTV